MLLLKLCTDFRKTLHIGRGDADTHLFTTFVQVNGSMILYIYTVIAVQTRQPVYLYGLCMLTHLPTLYIHIYIYKHI